MDISDNLLCLYSASVTQQDDTYTIEVPKQEIQLGDIQSEKTYRVALIPSISNEPASTADKRGETRENDSQSRNENGQAPVSEGDLREVEIENLGDKGDGITRIDGGYVVIVPDTEVGEQVTVRLEKVKKNVGFAEVVKRQHDSV